MKQLTLEDNQFCFACGQYNPSGFALRMLYMEALFH